MLFCKFIFALSIKYFLTSINANISLSHLIQDGELFLLETLVACPELTFSQAMYILEVMSVRTGAVVFRGTLDQKLSFTVAFAIFTL